MNIVKENIGLLNEVITITVEKNDYADRVTQKLKELKKTAVIKGFRPGTAPLSIVQKLFGKSVLYEEIERYVENIFTDYIKSNNIQLLFPPLLIDTNLEDAIEKENPTINFKFEIGLKPEINFTFSPDIKLNYYLIKITDDLIEGEIENYRYKYGHFVQIDEVEKDSMLSITVISENYKEKLINFSLKEINEDKIESFIGKKQDETVIFDLKELFPQNKQICRILNIMEKDIPEGKIEIEGTITLIEKFILAENNKELWDIVFPDSNINDETEFKENVKKSLKTKFDWYSENLFKREMWNYILENCPIDLPENFIKKKYVKENEIEIKNEFDSLKKDLFIEYFFKSNNLKVEESEIEKASNDYIKDYYKRYYNMILPEEYVTGRTKKLLENKNEYLNFYYIVAEDKLIQYVKEKVTLSFEEVTFDDFIKLFSKT